MATFHSPPERSLDNLVVLCLTQSRVLTADLHGVGVDVTAASECPTGVHAEFVLKHHGCRVTNERPYIRGGLRLPGYLVPSDPPPGTVDEHFKMRKPGHGRLTGAGQVGVSGLFNLPADSVFSDTRSRSPFTFKHSPHGPSTPVKSIASVRACFFNNCSFQRPEEKRRR